MAEYVEIGLEKLLPTFEELQASGLLSADELSVFIKRCRNYEYQVAKRNKQPKDFIQYAEYIAEQLGVIAKRRKEIGYRGGHHRLEFVEKPLKYKAAFLYQLCSDRFKKRPYFEREITYLKSANLLGACSQAYTRLLRLHGHHPECHEEAGRFEFFLNRSGENARTLLQAALRRFPQYMPLWTTLFEVELRYVDYLHERRQHLMDADGNERQKRGKRKHSGDGEGDADDPPASTDDSGAAVTDAVLRLKLAKIVQRQAIATASEDKKPEMLYRLWKVASEVGSVATRLESKLYRQLIEHQPPLEEAVLARLHKESGLSHFELYDTALAQMPTARMLRSCVDYCEQRVELGDVSAEKRLPQLLKRLYDTGEATHYERKLHEVLRTEEQTSANAEASRDAVAEKLTRLHEAYQRGGGAGSTKTLAAQYETLLAEWGSGRVDCWIHYVRYLMQAAPERVGLVNQRALLNLKPELVEDFHAKWTRLQMGGDVDDEVDAE